jgi:3-hydroxyisobutyrate dehydrogenase
MQRVGVIGLGNMGSALANNLLSAGFPLCVYDIRPEAATSFIERGAEWCSSPAALAVNVDVVISMVFGPKEIESVVCGEGGLLSGDCSGKIWIDLTTSDPVLMRELAGRFTEKAGCAIDAPVTGSLDAAIRGDMIMFVGGSDEVIARVQSILDAIGETRRVGDYGNGYVAKLVNNQLWKVHAAAIGEAMVLAKKAGLDPKLWWDVMKGGAADSFVLQHDVPSIFAGHYDPSFRLELALKDLDLIQKLVADYGTRSELTQACHDRFQEAADRYGTHAGEMSVCRLIEDDAGVSLRVQGYWFAPWEATPNTNH